MEKILLSHGSGGKLMHELLDSLIMRELDNPVLREKKDSAILKIGRKKIAFTTDSYVVDPIFFPGGDIGSLAVYGTINDLSVCGARPVYISLGLIIEEGLDKRILERIVGSIRGASKRAGVSVVTGDTKVVGKGSCDKLYINTSGIGEVYYKDLSVRNIKDGDTVIISGPIGDHAISVLSKREGLAFRARITSDSAPLDKMIYKVLKASTGVRFMRDPTRGGLATTLNEVVKDQSFGIALEERDIPIRGVVRGTCELLGFDPLYLACEGAVMMVVSAKDAGRVIRVMRRDTLGRSARCIGIVTRDHPGKVYVNTAAGGKRTIEMLAGEQLPRIC